MNISVIDGKALASKIKAQVKKEVCAFLKLGEKICFAAVIVGDNAASKVYIETKRKACLEAGIEIQVIALDSDVSQKNLNTTISELSADSYVHGILLQLPLPTGLNAREAITHIDPRKDVDGLTSENFGKLASEEPVLVPCTALGIVHILKSQKIKIVGKNITVIGRSNIVGKPTALLLQKENATVTVCHKFTKNLTQHTKNADIVIVAAGCPNLIKGSMIKQGAIVIDVGINRVDGKICGDVNFQSAVKKASIITPVPGGVGPLTIAFLLSNILASYKLQRGEQ